MFLSIPLVNTSLGLSIGHSIEDSSHYNEKGKKGGKEEGEGKEENDSGKEISSLKELNIQLPHHPAIPLMVLYPKN